MTTTKRTEDKPKAVAVYRRISSDREGKELGVTRQAEDLDDFVASKGYNVVAVYQDNDKGASTRSRKRRPDYERMLADAKAGKFQMIVAYTSSRLTRRPEENGHHIQLAERYGIRYDYIKSPVFDLNTAGGRMIARILADIDCGEAEQISERVSRAYRQRVENGGNGGGGRCYGFNDDGLTLRADEENEIRRMAETLLSNDGSLRGIVADLERRNVPTVTGKPWNPASVRGILLRPRNAGRLVHQGQDIGRAPWPAILTEDTHAAIVDKLTADGRRSQRGTTTRHLGSGIYRCGVEGCGRTLHVSQSGGRTPVYRCSPVAHLTRNQADLDDMVVKVLVERLSRPDALDLFTTADGADTAAKRQERMAVRTRIGEAKDAWEAGVFTLAEMKDRVARLQDREAELDQALLPAAAPRVLSGIAGCQDVRAWWEDQDLDRQRAILRLILAVTVLPTAKGRRPFDPSAVRVEFRS